VSARYRRIEYWFASYSSGFQSQVRALFQESSSENKSVTELIELASSFGMEDPQILSWPAKHGNVGHLVFEYSQPMSEWRQNFLDNVVALLGLCGN